MANYVLIAEDNPMDQKIIKTFVESCGYIPICANDGYEAADLIDEFDYSLFIVDLQLPILNGHKLIRRIRARQDLNESPVIVTSGRSEKTDVLTAIKSGASDYAVKPITIDVFDEKIGNLLSNAAENWSDYYLDPEKDVAECQVLEDVEILSINPHNITFFSEVPFNQGKMRVLNGKFLEGLGLKELKIKVTECKEEGEKKFKIRAMMAHLTIDDRRKIRDFMQGKRI